MCDVNKYSRIYDDILKLQPEDTLQLILESKDDRQKDFYCQVGNYLLREKQKEAIERNLF